MKFKRACWSKSFGKKEQIFCNCSMKEVKKCRDNYDQHKKENYVDSKGQVSFRVQKDE